MRKWKDLPEFMKCAEVKEYYDILSKKKISLALKRAFDIVAGHWSPCSNCNSNACYWS